MNRGMSSNLVPRFMVLAAAGVLVWHVVACVESPMAFSPAGDLAFTTVTPHPMLGGKGNGEQEGDFLLAGSRTYRLMLLPHGEKAIRVLEETNQEMLSGTGYSQDGSEFCYIRVPLIAGPQHAELMAERQRKAKAKGPQEKAKKPEGPAVSDLTLPALEEAGRFFAGADNIVPPKATLVIRDAKSGDVRSTLAFRFPPLESVPSEDLNWTYMLTRPQYSPDGKWIYFTAGGAVLGVSPAAKEVRLLAGPGVPALGPDGKTLAVLGNRSIGFVSTDGSLAVYKRCGEDVSLKDFAWRDNDTLAVISTAEKDGKPDGPLTLTLLGRDRSTIKTQEVKVPGRGAEPNTTVDMEELAVAPDGNHMVVVRGTAVLFLADAGEKLLSTWKEAGAGLFQPTFTHDSKQVAFKYAKANCDPSVIIFFTAEGKELSRVEIPPLAKPARPPAEKPAKS